MMMRTAFVTLMLAFAIFTVSAQVHQRTPPSGKSGHCYSEMYIPDRYETITEMVRIQDGHREKRILPATYTTRYEQVIIQPETVQEVQVPAQYEWATRQELVRPEQRIAIPTSVPNEMAYKQVLVTPERVTQEHMPIQYETVYVQELVTGATTRWERQYIPHCQPADSESCHIWKQVHVPAEYKSVPVRGAAYCPEGYQLKENSCVRLVHQPAEYVRRAIPNQQTPAPTQYKLIPAEYRTVRYRRLVSPAAREQHIVPAAYKSVERQHLATPERQEVFWHPPEYRHVTHRKLVEKGGYTEWREVLCPEKMTPAVLFRIYQSLEKAGYSPGPSADYMTPQAQAALVQFQQDQGLPQQHLDFATLEQLGLKFE